VNRSLASVGATPRTHLPMPAPTLIDPKRGEREYFARIGDEGRRHAAGKPFTDEHCADYLAKTVAFLLLMPAPPARVVEFGCGTGWLSLIFAARGYDVIGVDISPDAIQIAEQTRAAAGRDGISFRIGDYEDAAFDAPVDCVVFHDALHHAESEALAMRAAFAALRPGGMVICMEPGEGHRDSAASQTAVARFGVHEKDMPPRTIIRHARAAGFDRHLVLPWPSFLFGRIYRRGYTRARTSADLRGKKWLSLFRFVRSFFQTRAQGVVILWKP
jgi:SAM-dependent methyltransferase